jgi:hypothetical protein
LEIIAKEKWNHTGFQLERGVEYSFSARGQWIDWYIVHGPDGDGSGWNLFLRAFERFRRRPDDKWFALIGAVGEDESTTFLIGSSNPRFKPVKTGELTCYANDAPWAYGNNKGSIQLTVVRLD